MRDMTIVALCAWIAAGAASAQPLALNGLDGGDKGWFYNRSGATASEAATDLAECRLFANQMRNPPNAFVPQRGLVVELMAAALTAGFPHVYADDCMLARGYRRYDTENENIAAFQGRFAGMDEFAQTALAGAQQPVPGEPARAWDNSLWLPAESDPVVIRAERRLLVAPGTGINPNPLQVQPLGDAAAVNLGDDHALLVVTLSASGFDRGRPTVVFARDNDQGFPDRVGAQRARRWPLVSVALRRADSDMRFTRMFIVPAGRYALSGVNGTQLCLGTIMFQAMPGDVLHLGDITMRAGGSSVAPFQLRIDSPDMAAARALLTRAPELAPRLRAVDYFNGFIHACQPPGWVSYGFDLPGAPWWTREPEEGEPSP